MNAPMPKSVAKLVTLVGLLLLVLFISCDPKIDPPPPDSRILLELGEKMTEGRTFLAARGVTEDALHSSLLDFTVGFNRVATLVNSVIYADMEQTDRELLKRRVDAAIRELDAFDAICKELEAVGTKLHDALDEYDAAFSPEEKQLMSRSVRAEEGDTWYARRLVELMLDYENPVRYKLDDVSRRTGVSMKKLHYIMQQTAEQMNTQVDIVDAEEYDKEIAYLETVRDTAGKINATLALATPLGAFGSGAATATGASAIGWVAKGKQALTVVENANAVITFTDGVVNLAVNEEDIPPAFKTVAKYNQYVGIALGGTSGFKDISSGEKIIGIVGAATDATTVFFDVKDDKVQVATTPIRPDTPAVVLTEPDETLQGILPDGKYKVPDVDMSEWVFPEFDWGDEAYWENLYDDLLIGETYDAFMEEMDGKFQELIDSWDPSANNGKRREVEVDSDGMPDFFDDPEGDFPDHDDVAEDPDPTDFSVQAFANISGGIIPFTVSFTAVPNGAFLYGQTEFTWDFGDGSAPITVKPSDPSYGATVVHEYTNASLVGTTVIVSLEAADPRGYSARTDKLITIGATLQQRIDSSTSSTFTIPDGTYYEHIVIPAGMRISGSKESTTIIEGSVTLGPDTVLENLTVHGVSDGSTYSAISNNYDAVLWGSEYGIDIDLRDVTVINKGLINNGIDFEDKWNDEDDDKVPFVGTIERVTVKDFKDFGIVIRYFDGIITDCLLQDNVDGNLLLQKTSESALVQNNEVSGSWYGIEISELHGIVCDNTIGYNTSGLYVGSVYPGAEVYGNALANNGPIGGMFVGEMSGGDIYENTVTANTRFGSYGLGTRGGGMQVNDMVAGTIRNNTFTANKGSAVYIENLGTYENRTTGYVGTGPLLTGNILQDNVASTVDSLMVPGGMYIEHIYDGAVLGNTFTRNTTDGQTDSDREGGGLYVYDLHGEVSGNTFEENVSRFRGGGASLQRIYEVGVCSGNAFTGNAVDSASLYGQGGGLFIGTLEGTCDDNVITQNDVTTLASNGKGGGVHIGTLAATGSFSGNTITGNTAENNGGGCHVVTRIGSAPYPWKVSVENSISGNGLTDPMEAGSWIDLFTPWTEDRLREYE